MSFQREGEEADTLSSRQLQGGQDVLFAFNSSSVEHPQRERPTMTRTPMYASQNQRTIHRAIIVMSILHEKFRMRNFCYFLSSRTAASATPPRSSGIVIPDSGDICAVDG